MSLSKLLAGQLSHPRGFVGKFILPRLWNSRNTALNDVALAHLALTPSDYVLDVGFGGGYLLARIVHITTTGFTAGVDASAAVVEFCQKQYRALVDSGKLALKCASAESLPFPDGYFTKVCSVNSIFYWQDVPKALTELWRVLANNGILVLCFTAQKSLNPKKFARRSAVKLYEVDEVHQMLESAGFREIKISQAQDKHREFFCIVGKKSG
ncbi:MAG: methyltransferase domain-containing protein [Anaerolineae bacterium]|nr:methyltransferase domain-containing protein [Anaerolineae bacterium]